MTKIIPAHDVVECPLASIEVRKSRIWHGANQKGAIVVVDSIDYTGVDTTMRLTAEEALHLANALITEATIAMKVEAE